MAGSANTGRAAGRQGFVLVAVLWMVAALATLAAVFSIYVSRTAAASHVADDRLQAEAAIRSSVDLAADQLLSAPEGAIPTHGQLQARVGKISVAVRYESEAARIDLNAAPKELLAGLFEAIGASETDSAEYADRIVGWRQPPAPAGLNTEAADYVGAGLAYPPRQQPFADTLELALVLGIPRPVVDRVLPFVTIFNGHPEIDVLDAAPEVVAALPGMTPETLTTILTERTQPTSDPASLQQALGAAGKFATMEGRASVRAMIEVALGHHHKVRAEVVFLLLKEGDEPYRILDWRDDFDQPL